MSMKKFFVLLLATSLVACTYESDTEIRRDDSTEFRDTSIDKDSTDFVDTVIYN